MNGKDGLCVLGLRTVVVSWLVLQPSGKAVRQIHLELVPFLKNPTDMGRPMELPNNNFNIVVL